VGSLFLVFPQVRGLDYLLYLFIICLTMLPVAETTEYRKTDG
jgi:hypothetical protein